MQCTLHVCISFIPCLLSPISSLPPQILGCACDLGTFVCGVIVAVVPATDFRTM